MGSRAKPAERPTNTEARQTPSKSDCDDRAYTTGPHLTPRPDPEGSLSLSDPVSPAKNDFPQALWVLCRALTVAGSRWQQRVVQAPRQGNSTPPASFVSSESSPGKILPEDFVSSSAVSCIFSCMLLTAGILTGICEDCMVSSFGLFKRSGLSFLSIFSTLRLVRGM